MKLSKRDIDGFISRPDTKFRGILLYGPDSGQVSLYRKQVLTSFSGGDTEASTQLTTDAITSEPTIFYEALSSISLLGGTPVVMIDPASDKLTSHLEKALDDPACQNFLILCGGELSPRSSLRSLCEKHPALASFACYRDEGADLSRIIEQLLREKQITANRECIQFLSANLGNDRSVTYQEIEKIDLYLGDCRTLSIDDAKLLVGSNDNLSLDEFYQAICSGRFPLIFSLLQKLQAEGMNEIALIRSFTRHMERLKSCLLAMQSGISADAAMGQLRPPVFYKYKQPFRQHLSRLSLSQVTYVLACLLEAERNIKRGMPAQPVCEYALTLSAKRMAS